MMEISAASAYTIIFARNSHKVRDFLAIAKKRREKTFFTLRSTTFVMSRSRENYVMITRKQDRKIIIMHGRLELPLCLSVVCCYYVNKKKKTSSWWMCFSFCLLQTLTDGLVWIIVMFLSAVWTLILTAPIHCRASISEQVMQCYISANLKMMGRSWTIRSIETNL